MSPGGLFAVGIAGVGRMGGAAATALVDDGAAVVAHDPSSDARARAAALGVTTLRDPRELWAAAPVVILSLPNDDALAAVMRSLRAGSGRPPTILDLSTVSVAASLAARETAAEAGAHYIDCPVIGGATNVGSWTVLVGAQRLPSVARKVLSVLGRIELVGHPGDGLRLKLINNMMLAMQAAGVCEAIAMTRSAGIDVRLMHGILARANSVALSRLFVEVLPRALDSSVGDVFSAELMLKDARLALELGGALDVRLPTIEAAVRLLESLASGHEDEDFTRLFTLLAQA